MKFWIFFGWFSATSVLFTACSRPAPEHQETAAPVTVTTEMMQVRATDVDVLVTATGTTDVLRKQTIVAPVSGWITSLKTLEGTVVKRGTVMAQLRPKESQSAITGADAMLRSAHSDAERMAAKHAQELAESAQTSIDVVAGLDGIVATRTVAEGELVSESSTMFTIIDLASVFFFADVPLQSLSQIHTGQRALVAFAQLPDREFPADVESINPQAESASQTVKVRLRLSPRTPADRSMLRAGILGTANIITGTHHHALVVSRNALIRNAENDHYAVMIVGEDSLTHTVPVNVVSFVRGTAEITGDIHAGTTVIIRGAYGLADSTHITPPASTQ